MSVEKKMPRNDGELKKISLQPAALTIKNDMVIDQVDGFHLLELMIMIHQLRLGKKKYIHIMMEHMNMSLNE